MAKSNCPAEDSAPPQASAGQLTPRFLPLSLSGRLLQVTVAISPSAAKGASKGTVFCAHPIGRFPQANAGFRNGDKGELHRRNWKFCQKEGDADFRERVSRSIWRSELRLSGLVVCFCRLGKGCLLSGKFPSQYVFKRCICWGPS